ncbi:MAG: IS21 family transposase [Candidatus Binatia bacterium]
MSLIKKGFSLSAASLKAGMSEPTARKYRDTGKLPSQLRKRHSWRTRPDPFGDIWGEVEELLEKDGGLEAKTIFEEIRRRHSGRFSDGQLRTMQRRARLWRAVQGPDKEVFFSQVYQPGEQCQSDFTEMNSVGITILGQPLENLLYHFVLPYSNWEFVEIAYSESFEALSEGLQGALWELGAIPSQHRTDCLSAATHELRHSRGRGFNARYLELLNHYGMEPSKIGVGKAHENGDVEQSHFRFRGAVDQRLRLRGSRDFVSLQDYRHFLRVIAAERNRDRQSRLREELGAMKPLPARPLDSFREELVVVSRWSTVRVAGNTYSVPSRLRGYRLRACIYASHIELEYGGQLVERMERLRGKDRHRIDYRHLIHSLLRKPGAFQRYVYREALFPTVVFRKAYDSLVEHSQKWADLEYLRILHLAATTLESKVEEALIKILDQGKVPEYGAVRELSAPPQVIVWPQVSIAEPDLGVYDELLGEGEVAL